MGFFDSFPASPAPVEPPPLPPWFGPPPRCFGGYVPARLILVHTPSALLVVDRLLAFPSGLEFTTVAARRPGPLDMADPFFWDPLHRDTPVAPPDCVRFAIVFPDGQIASNLLDRHRGEEPPSGPVVGSFSGQGHRGHWERRWWLWPLPPAGPVRFVVEWPSEGVPETSAVVEADQLHAAAADALVLGDW